MSFDEPQKTPWIVCQLGAREHYALPAALQTQGVPVRLYTDTWLTPNSVTSRMLGRLQPRLLERHQPGIPKTAVVHFTGSSLCFEARQRLIGGPDGWGRIVSRNHWFQEEAAEYLRREALHWGGGQRPVVFAYSYAARQILECARDLGCFTVLGQIDPGPVEENLVAEEVARHANLKPRWTRTPEGYWENWRAECEQADRIIVNSEWSRKALMQAGVPIGKLAVVPLMYDEAGDSTKTPRIYPKHFNAARPLRILFLGALIIRKGIAEALEAARAMANWPVEFCFVGPEGVTPPADLLASDNLRWVGPVKRSQVAKYYDHADVFLFPTLSDGFGLTQIEAMARGLPVIASRQCGDVVFDGINGLSLKEVNGEEIVTAIETCLAEPRQLGIWSENALRRAGDFSSSVVLPKFIEVVH